MQLSVTGEWNHLNKFGHIMKITSSSNKHLQAFLIFSFLANIVTEKKKKRHYYQLRVRGEKQMICYMIEILFSAKLLSFNFVYTYVFVRFRNSTYSSLVSSSSSSFSLFFLLLVLVLLFFLYRFILRVLIIICIIILIFNLLFIINIICL